MIAAMVLAIERRQKWRSERIFPRIQTAICVIIEPDKRFISTWAFVAWISKKAMKFMMMFLVFASTTDRTASFQVGHPY